MTLIVSVFAQLHRSDLKLKSLRPCLGPSDKWLLIVAEEKQNKWLFAKTALLSFSSNVLERNGF